MTFRLTLSGRRAACEHTKARSSLLTSHFATRLRVRAEWLRMVIYLFVCFMRFVSLGRAIQSRVSLDLNG